MKIKFQFKLLLAFIGLIFLIIIPLLYLVNAKISSVSESNIEKSLRISEKVFEKHEEFRRQSASSAAESLLASQASIRAILGSTSTSSDDLFGDSPPAAAQTAGLQTTNETLFSSIESFELYQAHPIFIFTDAKGTLLLTKVSPKTVGLDLSALPVVREALMGNAAVSYWGSLDTKLNSLPLLPKTAQPTLYEVFAKPLVFGDSSVKGVMLVGFPITIQDLQEIKNISQSEIAFISAGNIYATSLDLKLNLNDLIKPTDTQLLHFTHDAEEFIGLPSPLKDSDSSIQTTTLIFKSKTKELLVYSDLKKILNIIGAIASAIAIFLAFLLSAEVSKAVRALMRGAKEIQAGNLNYLVEIKTKDEFADLGESFNKMSEGLREKESIKKTFKRYVSPKVVNSLLSDENKLKLGGDKRDLVIFFSDIAGFTTISEALSPEGTIDFLNQYLSEMAKIIEASEGVVDKFIGDAIMAYWIDPLSKKKNSLLACSAALEQQKMIVRLKEKWSDNPILCNVDARIGIHSGEVIIGNIGSEERMDYTIIGDNVNTASRLESINKHYGTSILISESVANEIKDSFILRDLDLIKVVGKKNPIRIYELLGNIQDAKTETTEMLKLFSAALQNYREGNFLAAQAGFQHIKSLHTKDFLCELYLTRCSALISNPPLHWDGVYQAKAK